MYKESILGLVKQRKQLVDKLGGNTANMELWKEFYLSQVEKIDEMIILMMEKENLPTLPEESK